MTGYEIFLRDRGWAYKNDAELEAAYERYRKSQHGILLTQDEFLIEAGEYYLKTIPEVYKILASFVDDKKIKAYDVYNYARFKWCLQKPESIVAYQIGHTSWKVNDCDEEIAHDDAMKRINREWGFEESRITLQGTPYYSATDYMFIRFDCGLMGWLWANGSLYQVYD